MSARQNINLQILQELEDFIKANPDQRFGQALVNLGILDRQLVRKSHDMEIHVHSDVIFEEPSVTLAKMDRAFLKMKKD